MVMYSTDINQFSSVLLILVRVLSLYDLSSVDLYIHHHRQDAE